MILLGWFAASDRTLLVQQPRHVSSPTGCFALRSPARPNPIAVSVAGLLGVDVAGGILDLDALDWFDGTPVVDIKPYYASTDALADAVIRER